MSKMQPVRGTKDVFGEEAELYQAIIDIARENGSRYGFKPFMTPVMEFTDVFKRTLGDTSDVVNKEMYTFEDRGGESITLRPEFTAGIVRAFISGGLQQHVPLKLFSSGPLFRYERPQKGRQRQFTQVNFEWLGAKEPSADVELVCLGHDLLQALGVHNTTLEINSLGNKESRAAYLDAFVAYMVQFESELSEDSKMRLTKNPLRILDSKDAGDKKLLENAPILLDYLVDEDKHRFDTICEDLTALGIVYHINSRIVRGLDYYNDLVFEFVAHDENAGAQNTVLAGGRYDNLVAQMGGPETPALGFAAGVERLALMAKINLEAKPLIAILPEADELIDSALKQAHALRKAGYSVECFMSGNFNKRMKKANKSGSNIFMVLGEDHTNYKVNDSQYDVIVEQIKEVI